MRCPACKNILTKIVQAGVKVLACRGECGGLWFNQSQVRRLEKIKPGLGTLFLKLKRADGIKFYRGVEHICPQCKTTLLCRHFFSKEWDTEVNQCAKCGGFWVDVAGLAELQSMDEQKKQKSVEKYFSIIGKKIAGIYLLNEDVTEAVKNIIRIFQFLCSEKDFPEAGREFGRGAKITL